MDGLFLVKLFLSFVIGSIWVTSATIIAEKMGTKLGGVIAGIPSTMVIALFFIGWTQSPVVASESTTLMPIILGINAICIMTYVLVTETSFYLSILISLALWFILSLGLVSLNPNNFIYSLVGCILLSIPSYYILEIKSDISSQGKRDTNFSFPQLLFRGILSGTIITFAVIISKITNNPLIGGIFASFPAVILSTIIITHFAHGRSFSCAVIKALMISATINGMVYIIAVRYLYLAVGLIYGTMLSYLFSLISGYLTYLLVNSWMS